MTLPGRPLMFRAALAAWVVLVACLVVGPQSSLARQVPPSGGDLRVESRLEIETAAGRVASVLLRLVNEGPRDRTVRLSPELPDGWSLLIPLSSVRVEAGGQPPNSCPYRYRATP